MALWGAVAAMKHAMEENRALLQNRKSLHKIYLDQKKVKKKRVFIPKADPAVLYAIREQNRLAQRHERRKVVCTSLLTLAVVMLMIMGWNILF